MPWSEGPSIYFTFALISSPVERTFVMLLDSLFPTDALDPLSKIYAF